MKSSIDHTWLSALPAALLDAMLTHPCGSFPARASSMQSLYKSLLAGRTPSAHEIDWPQEPLRSGILEWLQSDRLRRFSKNCKEVTEAILLAICQAGSEYRESVAATLQEMQSDLARLERLREGEPDTIHGGKKSDEGTATHDDLDQMEREVANKVTKRLSAEWAHRIRIWSDLEGLYGSLGRMLGIGWDLTQSVLQHEGWFDAARLRARLESSKDLAHLIRRLGRLKPRVSGKPLAIQSMIQSLSRVEEERSASFTPFVVGETRGIDRSDDIARMLPCEAVLLGHPVLKWHWHAKRADRSLLVYLIEGMSDEDKEADQMRRREPPPQERGPIIVCLDTSGSMAGASETIAKAVTLEMARVAFNEQRGLFVYLFSGPGNVEEHELTATPAGLGTILKFLGQSFHGGTDLEGPIRLAAEKLKRSDWVRSDLVIITDGEFGVPSESVGVLDEARQRGLHCHGVLIGRSSSAGLSSLCENVHHFRDWLSVMQR